MLTFQDFQRLSGQNLPEFVARAIAEHKSSNLYKMAVEADAYDRQLNTTIMNYVQMIWSASGEPIEDFTATNNRIASNFFHRLNMQRCTYSLGNGITFAEDAGGKIKAALGQKFDTRLKKLGYFALIHGVCFGFWHYDQLHVFPVTEFVPLWDEMDGSLKAGIRFWQIDDNKPMIAVLYEEDGYTKFTTATEMEAGTGTERRIVIGNGLSFKEYEPKRAYKRKIKSTQAAGDEVVGEENYSALPIIPMWGSDLHQSTLVGMKCAIDSFDLIRSGFANDLSDCTQIYWIVENCAGMTDEDLQRFRDKMKIQRIVEVGTGEDGVKVTPYTQDIPFAARQAYLTDIRQGIYEDFGALDVHEVNANSTNDHLDAAYQPMDENADDFEYQIIEFVQRLLAVAGLGENTPQFKRNRVSNQKETVEMVLSEAEYLDDETILNKLPNITPDEVAEILKRKGIEDRERMLNPVVPDEDEEVVTDGAGNGDGAEQP